MNPLTFFENRSRAFYLSFSSVLIGVIGILDFVTGYELAFSVFYVIPISVVNWFTGRPLGLAASVVSAAVWLAADLATGHPYSSPLIPIWNSLIRLSFYTIITYLLASVRELTERHRELSHTDHLTGAANSRLFTALAGMEIDRLQRYGQAFSMAYIDLDNFKIVNDRFGHSLGDHLLCTVVNCARAHMRRTDLVARLGGDEFALLMPETDEASARAVLTKLQCMLLKEMQGNGWPVTFSIGVVTCHRAPESVDGLVRLADALMYRAKHGGKNSMWFDTFGDGSGG